MTNLNFNFFQKNRNGLQRSVYVKICRKLFCNTWKLQSLRAVQNDHFDERKEGARSLVCSELIIKISLEVFNFNSSAVSCVKLHIMKIKIKTQMNKLQYFFVSSFGNGDFFKNGDVRVEPPPCEHSLHQYLWLQPRKFYSSSNLLSTQALTKTTRNNKTERLTLLNVASENCCASLKIFIGLYTS